MRSAVTVPSLRKSGVYGIVEAKAAFGEIVTRVSGEEFIQRGCFPAGQVLLDNLRTRYASHSPSKGNKAFPAGALLRGLFMARGKERKPNVVVGVSGKDGANYIALWLEHGTYKQPPQPEFRPAVLESRPQMAQIIAMAITEIVAEASQ